MKRIICFLSIILLLCSSSVASLAENAPLSLRDAYHLMDEFESQEYESIWEKKALEKENAQHTREWEKEYGPYTRWQGDVTAAYVQAYGFMPSHDALSVNPLSVLPHRESLSLPEVYELAAKAVSRKEKRLPREKLDKYFYTWEYCVSRELDWFWAPLGTWIISWYDTADRLICRSYVDDCARKVTIVFDYVYVKELHQENEDGTVAEATEEAPVLLVTYTFTGAYTQDGDTVVLSFPTNVKFSENWGNLAAMGYFLNSQGEANFADDEITGDNVKCKEEEGHVPFDLFPGAFLVDSLVTSEAGFDAEECTVTITLNGDSFDYVIVNSDDD